MQAYGVYIELKLIVRYYYRKAKIIHESRRDDMSLEVKISR